MKLFKTLLGVVLATSLFAVAAVGADTNAPVATSTSTLKTANNDVGPWRLSLAGVGTVGTTANTTFNGGLDIELGHTGKFILPLEAGLRQSIGLSYDNGSTWVLGTKVYNDWQLVKLGALEFDAGGNAGATYGNTSLAWTVAPEGIVRLWLTPKVNTFVRGEYDFVVNSTGVRAQNSVGVVFGVQVPLP